MNLIYITNQTLDLKDCRDAWEYNPEYNCFMLEDVLYTLKATTPQFQRLSIFVPEEYMNVNGTVNKTGVKNGYTAETAPIILHNNSAGYMQMPHMWLNGPRCDAGKFLKNGYVYVTCGNRGHESKDATGKHCGFAPINLIDLKMVVRFLRHNRGELPGDTDKIISVGTSAGGAMSTLLGVTGNNKKYDALLEENGAIMDESDAIFASQIYCPIIDLEHADQAYEWLFHHDKENENSPAGPAGVMTPFLDALSEKLKMRYIQYFNGMQLRHPEAEEILRIEADGGSAYNLLLKKLSESATKYLRKLSDGELDVNYSVEDYLSGNYTYMAPAPPPGPKPPVQDGAKPPFADDVKPPFPEKPDMSEEDMAHFAGPEAGPMPIKAPEMGAMTLGEILSRPPKGVKLPSPPELSKIEIQGDEKSAWLSWDGKEAVISDLQAYLLGHRRRMKPCPSFDTLTISSGENKVFGNPETPAMHFNQDVAEAIRELKEQFPNEYAKYAPAFEKDFQDEQLATRKYLINPFNFIGTEEKSTQAEHFRIRVGAQDADTAFTVALTLYAKLVAAGKDTDYALVWDQPHCDADYPGELEEWIESILR